MHHFVLIVLRELYHALSLSYPLPSVYFISVSALRKWIFSLPCIDTQLSGWYLVVLVVAQGVTY
jgi:hypothetical protein